MKRLFIFIALGAALAGCKTDAVIKAEAAQDHEQCASMGYERGTELYLRCRQLKAGVRLNEEAIQQQRGQALMQAGAAMMAASQPKPVTTTNCNRFMNQVTCQSY